MDWPPALFRSTLQYTPRAAPGKPPPCPASNAPTPRTPFGYDGAMLAGILMYARRCNGRDAATGALICRDDLFLQMLEGPEAAVEATDGRIRRTVGSGRAIRCTTAHPNCPSSRT